jgi:hypothetical protein
MLERRFSRPRRDSTVCIMVDPAPKSFGAGLYSFVPSGLSLLLGIAPFERSSMSKGWLSAIAQTPAKNVSDF